MLSTFIIQTIAINV